MYIVFLIFRKPVKVLGSSAINDSLKKVNSEQDTTVKKFIGPYEAHKRKMREKHFASVIENNDNINNSIDPLSSAEKSKLNLNIDIADPHMICFQREINTTTEISSIDYDYSKAITVNDDRSNGSIFTNKKEAAGEDLIATSLVSKVSPQLPPNIVNASEKVFKPIEIPRIIDLNVPATVETNTFHAQNNTTNLTTSNVSVVAQVSGRTSPTYYTAVSNTTLTSNVSTTSTTPDDPDQIYRSTSSIYTSAVLNSTVVVTNSLAQPVPNPTSSGSIATALTGNINGEDISGENEVLLKVKYVKPEIWYDPLTQHIFRKGKVYRNTNTKHYICKHPKCKGTCKVSNGNLIHLSAHSNHQLTSEEFLLNQRVKSALYHTSIFNTTLPPNQIYEEVLSLFPLFKKNSSTKKRFLAQISDWRKKNKQTITDEEYTGIKKHLQTGNRMLHVPECKWCQSTFSCYIVLPCGHLCLCATCQENFVPNAQELHYACCPNCSELLLEVPKKVLF